MGQLENKSDSEREWAIELVCLKGGLFQGGERARRHGIHALFLRALFTIKAFPFFCPAFLFAEVLQFQEFKNSNCFCRVGISGDREAKD